MADQNTTNVPIDEEGNLNPSWLPGETGYMSGVRGRPRRPPMSWTHANLGGTALYTALGHHPGLYWTDWYRSHLLGGTQARVDQDIKPYSHGVPDTTLNALVGTPQHVTDAIADAAARGTKTSAVTLAA